MTIVSDTLSNLLDDYIEKYEKMPDPLVFWWLATINTLLYHNLDEDRDRAKRFAVNGFKMTLGMHISTPSLTKNMIDQALSTLSQLSTESKDRLSEIRNKLIPVDSVKKLTLMDIYINSNREGVFVIAPDVLDIPEVIWNYDLCQQLPSATTYRYKSAVLTKSYMGGIKDGQPYKQSFVFMYYNEMPPIEKSKPVGTLTFTIDLTDGSLRFIESVMEF